MKNKYLILLSMLYLSFLLTSMILSYRFVTIGPILTVSSIFVIPFSYSISDIIAEVYGYKVIKSVIFNSFISAACVFFLLWLLIKLPAQQKYDSYVMSYNVVFGNALRVFASNFIAMFFGVLLNSYLIVRLKLLVDGRLFFVRSLFSSAIGEFLFTCVVVFFVQYGVSSSSDILEMICISFAMKLSFTVISSFIVAFIVKPIIEKADGGDESIIVNE